MTVTNNDFGGEQRWRQYRENVVLVVVSVAVVLVATLAVVSGVAIARGNETNDEGAGGGGGLGYLTEQLSDAFPGRVNESAELALLRPIVVSIFERAGVAESEMGAMMSKDDVDRYNERLVVVRPNNWLIYTSNGITFHYITSNVSDSRAKCVASGSLSAIEYRLRRFDEVDEDGVEANQATRRTLRFSCVNYTFDQLTRVFAQSANRTDIDLTDYFDKKRLGGTSCVPDFTIVAVLQLLVANAYV